MLRERVREIPAEISRALEGPEPPIPSAIESRRPWIVTGVGASEGPARFFSSLLGEGAGLWAQFWPLSAFIAGDVPEADACVVFSQHLSPNARAALARRERFREMVVVTSVREGEPTRAWLNERDVRVAQHGPKDESGLLLRVLGPAAATAIAARMALRVARARGLEPAWQEALGTVAQAVKQVAVADAPKRGRLVLVGAGRDPIAREGLRLKLVEGLGEAAVSLDVCGVAHGPLQSFFDEPATIITLEQRDDPARDLFVRLNAVLRPHHQVVRAVATLPRALVHFEHAMAVDTFVAQALAREPRDLGNWPGKGHDAPLYDVGRDALD